MTIRVLRRLEPFNYAKQVELQGAEHYAGLATDAPDKIASWVFTFLENRERSHYALFEALQSRRPLPLPRSDGGAVSVDEVVGRVAVLYRTLGVVPCDPHGTYERARDFEKNSIAFFEELMSRTRDARRCREIEKVLKEEQRHAELVSRLAQLYRRPNAWLSDCASMIADASIPSGGLPSGCASW
ncbi:MAG: hypothetical protein GF331_25690 [Chitinivibrionales bacterium]|nr:hypothetical protein [Chitinivibrionales bacterium]